MGVRVGVTVGGATLDEELLEIDETLLLDEDDSELDELLPLVR